jgi:hypothetical protein
VPENIFDRRTKLLVDGHDLKSVIEPREDRLVLLQNEEAEFMLGWLVLKRAQKRQDVLRYACFAALNDGGRKPYFHSWFLSK